MQSSKLCIKQIKNKTIKHKKINTSLALAIIGDCEI